MHDCLNLFFEQEAYITSDLFLARPESAGYSWNYINACDFAIMVIGNSYGTLTNTGVSQLHVSYLNAKTKNKPLVVLIKDGQDKPRQLNDLIATIKQQISPTHVHYFADEQDINQLIKTIYAQLQNAQPIPSLTSLGIIDDKRTLDGQSDDIKLGDTKNDSELDDFPLDGLPREALSSKSSALRYRNEILSPQLQDELIISCNAHAFKGGTLIEVAFIATTSWQQVLASLANHIAPFSAQGLWRILNELVTTQALGVVQTTHPEVHAISRCQVTKADVLWIRETLINAHWIEKSPTAKEAWRVTDLAKNLIKNQSQPTNSRKEKEPISYDI